MAVDSSAQEQATFERYFSGSIPVTGSVDHNLTEAQQAFARYFIVSGSADATTLEVDTTAPEADVAPVEMIFSGPN